MCACCFALNWIEPAIPGYPEMRVRFNCTYVFCPWQGSVVGPHKRFRL